MASKIECDCVESMMDTLVSASNLSNSSRKFNSPNIIKTDAELLKKEIEKLENNCATPSTSNRIRDSNVDFFMEGRYNMAKDNLQKALNSEGRDKDSAANAADRFYSFIIDNGARMIRCTKH